MLVKVRVEVFVELDCKVRSVVLVKLVKSPNKRDETIAFVPDGVN